MTGNDFNLVVVEDDEHDYEFLSRILKGYDIPFKKTWLKDGEEVIDYLEKIETYGDQAPCKNVFLMDVNLPKVNGLALVKIIKNHRTAKENFVIMLSGSKTKGDVETAEKNGCDCYLKKPFGKQEIKEFGKALSSKLSSLI